MLQSMTGYGKSACDSGNKKISVEIRSLNSKQLDINARVPLLYREKELEIRNVTGKSLSRGKIDITIIIETSDENQTHKINTATVHDYIRQMREIENESGLKLSDQLLQTVMRLPDVLSNEKDELTEEEWHAVSGCISDTLKEVIQFRQQEGQVLETDMRSRLDSIQELLLKIADHEENRLSAVRGKIEQHFRDLDQAGNIDQARLEQEMIYYIEKMDFTEEKIRLKNHCDFFIETLGVDEPAGKKLGFISQEMGREINTLGSKASDSAIQKIVVEMKDELEKIKEQLLNVL